MATPFTADGLMAELDAAGVFSRHDNGVIYSRRMTRDAEKAAAGAMYGKRGGNPALTPAPSLQAFEQYVKGLLAEEPGARVEFLESSAGQIERLDWLAQNSRIRTVAAAAAK